jgi:hypothetical protein
LSPDRCPDLVGRTGYFLGSTGGARRRGGRSRRTCQTNPRTARLLRGQRPIGGFTRWKEHAAYSKALERLLRDLKVEASPAPDG